MSDITTTSTAATNGTGPTIADAAKIREPRVTAADVAAMIQASQSQTLAAMQAMFNATLGKVQAQSAAVPAPSVPLPVVEQPTNTPVPPGAVVKQLAPSGAMDPIIGALPAANDRRGWDALCKSHGSAAIDAIDARIQSYLANVAGDCQVGDGKQDSSFFRITAYAAVKYYESSSASDFGGAHQLAYWESLSRGAPADTKLGKLRAYLARYKPVVDAIRPWADLRGELLGKDGFPELRRKGRWAKTASREVDFS